MCAPVAILYSFSFTPSVCTVIVIHFSMPLAPLILLLVQICKDIEHCLKRCKDLLTQAETENHTLASACTALTAVLSISGDTIFDAAIKITRPSGQNFAVYIREGYGIPFKLQQIQDCWNNICRALSVCDETSFHALWTFLQCALNSLLNPSPNRTVPGFEKSNARMCFYPPQPPENSMHIFVDGADLVLCVNFYSRDKFTYTAGWTRQFRATCIIARLQEVLLLRGCDTSIEPFLPCPLLRLTSLSLVPFRMEWVSGITFFILTGNY
uniref:Expressed protein n=1 Tax=Echinococcus granulosus TaxID=6210 RepID=A0A068W845_ECHGR|nr:expressed protein [Echinococcus granulosus]